MILLETEQDREAFADEILLAIETFKPGVDAVLQREIARRVGIYAGDDRARAELRRALARLRKDRLVFDVNRGARQRQFWRITAAGRARVERIRARA